MTCSRCSQPIEPGAAFCGNCGQAVQPAAIAPNTAPLPPLPPEQQPAVPAPATSTADQANQATARTPGDGSVPAYAVADQSTQSSESRAMVGLILAVLAVPGALVPVIGIILGISGLVLGTTSRLAPKKTISNLSVGFASLAILAAIGVYVYNVKAQPQETAQHGQSISTTDKSADTANDGTAIAEGRVADTPCFKAHLPQLPAYDNAAGSCSFKTYDTASSITATDIYSVDSINRKDLTESQFAILAKDTLSLSVKNNLPDFVVTNEKPTTFAGSPAYIISGEYHDNVGIETYFVYHPTAHGENVFVIVHGINNGKADVSVLAKNWSWK